MNAIDGFHPWTPLTVSTVICYTVVNATHVFSFSNTHTTFKLLHNLGAACAGLQGLTCGRKDRPEKKKEKYIEFAAGLHHAKKFIFRVHAIVITVSDVYFLFVSTIY